MELLSPNNKRIKRIQQLQKSSKKRREEGVFLVEGTRMYRESPEDLVTEIYMTPEMLEELGKPDKPYFLVDGSVFSKISDTQTPQGVLAVLKMPEYSFEEVTAARGTDAQLILVLEDLQDPGNLGTILRVGEAAGVTGFVLSKGCVDIFNPKVIRSTMGSIYRMKFTVVPDILKAVEDLKAKGIETYAAHLQGSAIFTDYDYKKPTAFFIGNEGNGLSDEITALADKRLFIPMEGSVESLNAGIAAAVLSYEAHRQRQK